MRNVVFLSLGLVALAALLPAAHADDRGKRPGVSVRFTPIKTGRSEDEVANAYADVASQVACTTFEMSEYNHNYAASGFVTQGGMWGQHALTWKGQRLETWLGFGAYYDPGQAQSLGVPYWSVGCADAARLDTLESAASYTYYPPASATPIDPAGSWICPQEADPEAGAIVAALGMHYWESPAYIDAQGFDTVYGTYLAAAVIEKVTLCSVNSNLPPEDLCGWTSGSPSAALANVGSCAGQVALDSVEISYWGDIPGYGYFPHVTIAGADWAAVYGDYVTTPTTIVLDPPEGTSDSDISAVQELAADVGSSILVLDAGELRYAD